MPLSPSKSRRNASPNNRKLTDFFKPTTTDLSSQKISSTISLLSPGKGVLLEEEDGTSRAASRVAPSCSFTSISSSSSSRRISTNGVHAVTNSDSDSLDDSDGSFDELEDADSFVPRKRLMITPPDEKDESIDKSSGKVRNTRQSERLSRNVLGRRSKDTDELLTPPRRKYRYSLADMLKQQARSTLDEARIAALEAEVQDTASTSQPSFNHSEARRTATAVAGDSEEGDRVLQALERTEALDHEQRFFLFGRNGSKISSGPFPAATLGNTPWATMMSRDTQRAHACLSGFATVMAGKGRFSAEATQWLGLQLLTENVGELCDAYVNVIKACAQHGRLVHASLFSLDTFYALEPRVVNSPSEYDSETIIDLSSLPYVLQVLQIGASQMKLDQLCFAIASLVLANVDHRIRGNTFLQQSIQNAIQCLIDHIPKTDLREAYDLLRHRVLELENVSPIFRYQAIVHFPAMSVTAHNLRRYLALACVTQDSEYRLTSSLDWANLVSRDLANLPEFRITESTDFTKMAAFAELLDVALDAGFSPENYPWVQNIAATQTDRFGRAAAPTSEESAFNAQIDSLILHVKTIKSRIKEAGAAHLRRLEARNVLERIERRLQHGIRSRTQPQKDAFGTDLDGFQRKFMESFVEKDSRHTRDTLP